MRVAAFAFAVLASATLARAAESAPEAAGSGRAEKIKLAVMDLSAAGVSPDLAATVTSLVATELERQEVFNVVSKAEIRAMLTHEAEKQALGCDAGASCMGDLGNALGVRYLVSGSLGKVGDSYTLNLALTDTQASKVEGRVSESAKEQNKLLEVAARSSKVLVAKILADRQATLLVTTAEKGATVKIDGQAVGVTPLPRRKIAWGPHLLEVEKTGFVTAIEDFTVLTKGIVERQVTMIPSPDFLGSYEGGAKKMRIGAWISTGVAVVALGTAAYFQADHLTVASRFDDEKKAYDAAPSQTVEAWTALSNTKAEADTKIGYSRVSAGIGLVAAAAATYFWVGGEDPERYARYREVAANDAAAEPADLTPKLSFGFVPGSVVGASISLP